MLEGSCDCGAVRYAADGALDEVTDCNSRHLPATGRAVGVLLAEAGDNDWADRDLYARRSHAGNAPVQDVRLRSAHGIRRR